MDLVTIFGDRGNIDLLQECARGAVIFPFGLLLLRLSGKRTFGKWSALDVVVSIIVGSNLSRALTGTAPFLGTLAATAMLVALHWGVAHMAARSRVFSRLVEGKAAELGASGKLSVQEMRKHAVSEVDLAEALRQVGLEDVRTSRKITLEPSGKITVLR